MPQTIAITGATGFIGSAVVYEFLSQGDRIIVLTRHGSDQSKLEHFKTVIRIVKYNKLNDIELIYTLSNINIDVLVHCGWQGVAGADRNAQYQIDVNIPTTLHSVELCKSLNIKRWIGVGSQAEYGNLNYKINETSPTMPTTLYGRAKLEAGSAALGLCDKNKIVGSWLRIFSTYGPNDAPNWFLPYVIQEFLAGRSPQLTKCEQLWDYLYISDAAKAITATANSSAKGIFNLGSGSCHTLRFYIETIRAILNTPLLPQYGVIDYRSDQVMHLEADISRITHSTGWHPAVNILDGLRNTIEFEKQRFQTNL